MEIKRITELTRDIFEQQYVIPKRPLLLKDAANSWPARRKWNENFFIELDTEKIVTVFVSARKLFTYTGQNVFLQTQKMKLANAIRLIVSRDGQQEFAYLAGKSIDAEFPDIFQDSVCPDLLDLNKVGSTNLWYSSIGCVTQMHYDQPNNFLAQIQGRKYIKLFCPDDFDSLYLDEGLCHFSLVDTRNVNSELFPCFKNAKALEVVVETGDILYIPPFWFHEVESLDVSISVNFWWKASLSQVFWPLFTRSLIKAYQQGNLLEALSVLEGLDDPLETAFLLNNIGGSWITVLILVSVFQKRENYKFAFEESVVQRISFFQKALEDGNEHLIDKAELFQIIHCIR